ncbi:hypothetical protein ABZX77_05850 [Streptomyces sp. NPDC004237]|uniref:hypothetical protein n=1 Tax=Streptomyces sp. NPDC004237 TaxID=3154455 RepID=UPI0033A561F4
MPEERRIHVLLCGGHLDGQWVDVAEGVSAYRAMKPQPLQLSPDPELTVPLPDVVEYRLEPMPIQIRHAGGRLWVGTLGHGLGRDEAIVRALFQRDVAQQLLGSRRADA